MPAIDDLLRSLELESTGDNSWTATNLVGHGFIFGGQLMGQAIVAALAAHPGKSVKTLHTIFARSGAEADPVQITLDPVHDGRSFGSTGVTISQGERVIVRCLVLLSADEPDTIRHADAAPDLPGPDDSNTNGEGDWQFQIIGDVDLLDPDAVGPPDLDVWTRFAGAPDRPEINQALIAYSTDAFLIGTAMRPHEGVGQAQAHRTLSTGVISHTLTFHEPLVASDWFLLQQHSAYAGHGRVYGRANVFGRDGSLAASFVQDAMVRGRDPGAGGL
jgi:acyl-CoA thioesterase